jgi:hypothetical protein
MRQGSLIYLARNRENICMQESAYIYLVLSRKPPSLALRGAPPLVKFETEIQKYVG